MIHVHTQFLCDTRTQNFHVIHVPTQFSLYTVTDTRTHPISTYTPNFHVNRIRTKMLSVRIRYGVATISRLLKIIGLFCNRALQKRPMLCKETYNFKEPTNRSHPIDRTFVKRNRAIPLVRIAKWRMNNWLIYFGWKVTHNLETPRGRGVSAKVESIWWQCEKTRYSYTPLTDTLTHCLCVCACVYMCVCVCVCVK